MFTRRRFLAQSGGIVLQLTGGARLLSAEPRENLPDGQASKGMITPATQQAIDQGLAYLARCQYRGDPLDGAFGTNQYQGNVAITSLAALAMMAGGYQPGRGVYGKVISRALDYVLNQEEHLPEGSYLHSPRDFSHGPMYGHGFGTLFLAEISGLIHSREVRHRVGDTLKKAVSLIVKTQNPEGGWRYLPERKEADISVTICQIMALRAARNAGIFVPKSTVDECIKYVRRCQDPNGGFRYMEVMANGSGFARTAAGVAALYSAGIYKDPAVDRGLEYLIRWLRENQPWGRHDMHYFYGHYYAAQAMWTAGGSYWAEWFPAVREELIGRSHQRPDGSWTDQICNHYATAMACIILQVPNNYLPILQK